MSQHSASLDLPLITEATNDYYRNIYADPDLGPIFKGINMVVLRTHVSYFIHQLTMFDTPMTQRQLEYLRKVHEPIIAKHGVTQRHYDLMLGYLTEAMKTNGAEVPHLDIVNAKLSPLRDVFPPAQQSEDGHVVVHEQSDVSQTSRGDGGAGAGKAKGHGCPVSLTGHQFGGSSGSSSKPAWLKRLLKPFNKKDKAVVATTAARCPFDCSASSSTISADNKSMCSS